ncbi:hypothetical protein VTH06DRAFT_7330 [Thermothelomyces fergusii]
MKYGEHFEKESVPRWSLHNIDYNSLKQHIKAHTSRDQATAIAIPGRPNTALAQFEDDFYAELCRQHDRVDLFVSTKADEISRRLQHLSTQIHRLILRCATSGRGRMPLKRRRRFARYEQDVVQCGDDIGALQRFVSAQVVAFRKIIKKYRKWTGSVTLGARFRDNVLSHRKSFTRRDFTQLQARYEDLLQTLRAALPAGGVSLPRPESRPPHSAAPRRCSPAGRTAASEPQQPTSYWNEYDCGSEAGDSDRNGDGYAIYIDPNQDAPSFPGLGALCAFFATSARKLGGLASSRRRKRDLAAADTAAAERGPSSTITGPAAAAAAAATALPRLLLESSGPPSRPGETNASGTGTDLEDRRASSSPPPPSSSSTADRRAARRRARALAWATWGCFGAAFALMGLAAVLVAAGRRGTRPEADAGVTLGIVASLGLACGALSVVSARSGAPGLLGRLAAWLAFAVVCAGDGMLLVLITGNAKR